MSSKVLLNIIPGIIKEKIGFNLGPNDLAFDGKNNFVPISPIVKPSCPGFEEALELIDPSILRSIRAIDKLTNRFYGKESNLYGGFFEKFFFGSLKLKHVLGCHVNILLPHNIFFEKVDGVLENIDFPVIGGRFVAQVWSPPEVNDLSSASAIRATCIIPGCTYPLEFRDWFNPNRYSDGRWLD